VRAARVSLRQFWEKARRRLHVSDVGAPATRVSDPTLVNEAFLRRLERLVILTRRFSAHGLIGEHRSRRQATSFEFADYRRYVPGDDIRRIDWNAYGRLEELFVKLTEAKEDLPIHLLLDCSRSMDWGSPSKFLYARQLAAALGYLALSRFDAVTVATFGEQLYDRFPLVRGKDQALNLLWFLDNLAPGNETDFGASMRQYCRNNHRRGLAIVISDLHAQDGYESGIDQLLQARMEVHVLHIVDPREVTPDFRGEIEFVDLETGEQVELTIGAEAVRLYQQRFEAWCAEIESYCNQRAVSYLRVETSTTLEQLILRDMRQRKVVR